MNKFVFTLIAFSVLLFGCLNNLTPIQNNSNTHLNDSNQTSIPVAPTLMTIETSHALDAARSFVENSPTYLWDGSSLDLIEIYSHSDCAPGFYELFGTGEQGACVQMSESLVFKDAYVFKFAFTSSHGGYGNRSGQIVTQAFTNHLIAVTVKNNDVISAIIDGKWDEVNQEALPGQ